VTIRGKIQRGIRRRSAEVVNTNETVGFIKRTGLKWVAPCNQKGMARMGGITPESRMAGMAKRKPARKTYSGRMGVTSACSRVPISRSRARPMAVTRVVVMTSKTVMTPGIM
jgi:hypothetical protein